MHNPYYAQNRHYGNSEHMSLRWKTWIRGLSLCCLPRDGLLYSGGHPLSFTFVSDISADGYRLALLGYELNVVVKHTPGLHDRLISTPEFSLEGIPSLYRT